MRFVPVVLGLIFILLYLTFSSVKLALLVVGNIPLALVRGITALWPRGGFGLARSSLGRLHNFSRKFTCRHLPL